MTAHGELDALSAAILEALAETPDTGVSLPRLAKRLGLGASVLTRRLTLMGPAVIGGTAGPDWVRTTQQPDGRWVALATEAGLARIAAAAR